MRTQPLAEKFRPQSLEEVVGQEHLIGAHGFLSQLVQKKRPLSLLLWGPAGSGKTTIARLYSQAFGAQFLTVSGASGGLKSFKDFLVRLESQPLIHQSPVVFVDEIHRFNRAQQDTFLPYVENGSITLIGASTENPSLTINGALLSRLRVLELKALKSDHLHLLLKRYEETIAPLALDQEGRDFLVNCANGDGRYLFNLIENIVTASPEKTLTIHELEALLQRKSVLFDRQGEHHYNLISALHKSVRGSDPDASLYWLCRMLEGGVEPLFLARRLIRMASEDIGLADPQALNLCNAAKATYEHLGSPEGELALAQATIYLALAPKSNAIYLAYKQARLDAKESHQLPPPKHILNAPTKLMDDLGYGAGYEYDHDAPDAFSGQNYFPEDIEPRSYYHPVERGFERDMSRRLQYFDQLRRERAKK